MVKNLVTKTRPTRRVAKKVPFVPTLTEEELRTLANRNALVQFNVLDREGGPTEEITKMLTRLAWRFSSRTRGAVDVGEFQSLANYNLGVFLTKYDVARSNGASPKNFLYKRVYHAMQDYLRSVDPMTRTERREKKIQRYIVPLEPTHDMAVEDESNEDESELLRELLGHLDPVQRTIIKTVHHHEMNFTKAAKQCCIPVQRFRRMYSISLEKMRRRAEVLMVDKGQREEDRERLLKAAGVIFG